MRTLRSPQNRALRTVLTAGLIAWLSAFALLAVGVRPVALSFCIAAAGAVGGALFYGRARGITPGQILAIAAVYLPIEWGVLLVLSALIVIGLLAASDPGSVPDLK
jgi:hypothetical protein